MKSFDDWNEQKKNIESRTETYSEPTLYPKEGEVWMSVLGKNIGFEQNGGGDNFSRPFLVVKKFNNHMFWVVPLSSKQKSFNFYFNFIDPEENKVSVILAQMRLVSIKRFKRKMYEIDMTTMSEIKIKIRSFI